MKLDWDRGGFGGEGGFDLGCFEVGLSSSNLLGRRSGTTRPTVQGIERRCEDSRDSEEGEESRLGHCS